MLESATDAIKDKTHKFLADVGELLPQRGGLLLPPPPPLLPLPLNVAEELAEPVELLCWLLLPPGTAARAAAAAAAAAEASAAERVGPIEARAGLQLPLQFQYTAINRDDCSNAAKHFGVHDLHLQQKTTWRS